MKNLGNVRPRLTALFMDGMVGLVLLFGLGLATSWLEESWHLSVSDGGGRALFLLVIGLYFSLMEGLGRGTVGKRDRRLVTLAKDGGPLPFQKVVVRNLVKLAPLLGIFSGWSTAFWLMVGYGGINIAFMVINNKGMMIHDWLGHSRVLVQQESLSPGINQSPSSVLAMRSAPSIPIPGDIIQPKRGVTDKTVARIFLWVGMAVSVFGLRLVNSGSQQNLDATFVFHAGGNFSAFSSSAAARFGVFVSIFGFFLVGLAGWLNIRRRKQ